MPGAPLALWAIGMRGPAFTAASHSINLGRTNEVIVARLSIRCKARLISAKADRSGRSARAGGRSEKERAREHQQRRERTPSDGSAPAPKTKSLINTSQVRARDNGTKETPLAGIIRIGCQGTLSAAHLLPARSTPVSSDLITP
jgi:hypothetical protein